MILVTGAAGFIGYRTAKELKRLGEKVIAVDELLFFESRKEHQDLNVDLRASPADALEESFYEDLQAKETPVTAIIHLGACTDTTEMRVSYLTEVNLEYSKKLWNLASKLKIPFAYASSAATYGGGELGYADEESKMAKLQPLNPYGDSKLQFDLWALAEEKNGHAPPAWSGFKFFNVYGFGERHKGKMSSVVLQGFDQILTQGKLKLFRSHREGIANGEQKRDFVFVDDVVKVLLFAIKNPIKRGIYNLGSGQARSFHDLAKATFQAMGKEPVIEFIDTPIAIRDRYQYFTQAEMQKLKSIGFTDAFTSLEEGVKKTVRALEDQKRN